MSALGTEAAALSRWSDAERLSALKRIIPKRLVTGVLRETGKEQLLEELDFERQGLEYFYTRQRKQLGRPAAVWRRACDVWRGRGRDRAAGHPGAAAHAV